MARYVLSTELCSAVDLPARSSPSKKLRTFDNSAAHSFVEWFTEPSRRRRRRKRRPRRRRWRCPPRASPAAARSYQPDSQELERSFLHSVQQHRNLFDESSTSDEFEKKRILP